jgi:hypothetical protein
VTERPRQIIHNATKGPYKLVPTDTPDYQPEGIPVAVGVPTPNGDRVIFRCATEADARYIVGSSDPRYGWCAMLDSKGPTVADGSTLDVIAKKLGVTSGWPPDIERRVDSLLTAATSTTSDIERIRELESDNRDLERKLQTNEIALKNLRAALEGTTVTDGGNRIQCAPDEGPQPGPVVVAVSMEHEICQVIARVIYRRVFG